jgi:hypothetical protein
MNSETTPAAIQRTPALVSRVMLWPPCSSIQNENSAGVARLWLPM